MIVQLSMPAKQNLFHFFSAMLFLLIILADQIIKTATLSQPNRYNFLIIGDFFELKSFSNYNLSFLNFIYLPVIIYAIATLVIFLVFYKYVYYPLKIKNKANLFLLDLGAILVVGGTLSNLSDRIRFGFVIDYFFLKWPVSAIFNLADIAILLGSFLLIKEVTKTKF